MSREYFKDAEQAIIDYNKETDINKKNKIYEDKIHYAFYKLSENLIHSFKFYYTEVDDLEHLKHEVEVFLFSKIDKFNPDLGYKAYSYFGTIGKRYLILYNQKNYQKKLKSVPLEPEQDPDAPSRSPHARSIRNMQFELNENKLTKEEFSMFMDEYINFCYSNLNQIFKEEIDRKVADAILEILKNRYNIIQFKKKALYIYIRNQVEVKTQKITKVVNKLYDILWPALINYLENDLIHFNIYNKK